MPEEEKKEDPPAAGAPVEAEAATGEEDPVVEEEEEECGLAAGEFYPDDHVERRKADSALSRRSLQFYDCFG